MLGQPRLRPVVRRRSVCDKRLAQSSLRSTLRAAFTGLDVKCFDAGEVHRDPQPAHVFTAVIYSHDVRVIEIGS